MKKKIFKIIFCLAFAFAFGATGIGLEVVKTVGANASITSTKSSSGSSNTTVQDLGVVRPENIDEGLSVKSLDDIRGRRVTVRQPIMEVLDYNVNRPKKEDVKVLSDTYEFLDFETGEKIHDLAQVTFEGTLGDVKDPKYPMRGLNNSPKDSDKQTYFSAFEKYALLRQAYYFNTNAQKLIKEGKLYKHPAADYIYGEIPDSAKAVKMRIVTDPIYTSPMTTGLYLVPGEVVTIKIKGLKEGDKLNLYTHHQDTMGYKGYNDQNKDVFGSVEDYFKYWDAKIVAKANAAQQQGKKPNFEEDLYGLHGQWKWQNQKVPCMGTKFEFTGTGDEMTVEIGSMYGGPLYFQPTKTPVEMIIEGAVLTPHFVLGVTKIEDFEKYYKNAPGLIATLDVENGQLIGPAVDMRNCDDMEKLAYFWHSVFAIDISLNGREYNYNMTMCYDIHVPAGEAVALNSNFCAQPTYWFDTCMNYEELTTKGNWGTFHELGHVQAKTYGVNWGFAEGDGEVWNNTLILIIYSLLCNMDTRLVNVEHGEYVHPYTAITRSLNITKKYKDKDNPNIIHEITDYGQINNGDGAHFDQLSMYATLLHSFGPEKFIDMFYTYKLNPAFCENKRADFVYRIGLVDRVNILKWVNGNYFANIQNGYFTSEQLAFLNSLPDFYPVAYRWANGIDGNETARKYEVDGKFKTIFDLSGDNIISPEHVDIIDVTNAKYGKTTYDSTRQKVTYQPPENVTEYDSFDIIVSTLGGRKVSLNVNLKLLYRGTYAEVWDLGEKTNPHVSTNRPTLEIARDYASKHDPTSFEESSSAGKNDFNHPNLEYFRMKFKYVATESGLHTFYLRADDVSRVEFYNDGQTQGSPLGVMFTTSDKPHFSDSDSNRVFAIQLEEGQILDVQAELVNWGGLGNLHIGVKMPSDSTSVAPNIPDIPTKNIVNAGVSEEELKQADSFKGWQPQFVDSIKDASMDNVQEKDTWEVLEAPTHEGINDKSRMIDGKEDTFYHSHYSGNSKPDFPHIFVFDMKSNQEINYFEILRRSNATDKIKDFALYGMKDCEYNPETMGGENYNSWTKLYDSPVQNPNSTLYRVTFDIDSYRYLKLAIKSNDGQTVIKEVYAGITSTLNQTVKPSNYQTANGNTNFEENPANGKLSANTQGATFEFEFLGSGFEIYSDTGENYGSANVFIDGNSLAGVINLNEKETMFNKCVFRSGTLKTEKHKVKIVTTSAKPFNISFINVVYGTPVDEEDYPALKTEDGKEDFGDESISRQFTREWRTYIKDYNEITSLKFLKQIPADYEDTYIRLDKYIRIYRGKDDSSKLAIVYPGTILAPSECGSLFAGCENLKEIDFTNFDTSLVWGAVSMFNGCSSLKKIDLSSFKTDNIQSLGTMFANCIELEELDLSGLKLLPDANAYRMFENCVKLKTIKLPKKFDGSVKVELPYVYQDSVTKQFVTEMIIDSSTAGHTYTLHNQHTFNNKDSHHERIDPKCTDTGKIEYYVCDICSFNFDSEEKTKLLSEEDIIIPALDHSPEYDMEHTRFPTCTQGGGTVLVCKVCGEILGIEEASPADGHWFALDEKGYDFVDNRDGTATLTFHFRCANYDWNDMNNPIACGHEEDVVIIINSVETPANCENAQTYTFNTVITEEIILAILNPEGKLIPDRISFRNVGINKTTTGQAALGHDYVGTWGEWTSEDNGYTRELVFNCQREECNHEKTVKIQASVVTTDADCENDGSNVYTVEYSKPEDTNDLYDQELYSESKTEIIERLKHNYKPVENNALQWANDGENDYHNIAVLHLYCTKCNENKTIELISTQTVVGANTCGQNASSITYTVEPGSDEIIEEIKAQIGDNLLDENALKALGTLTYVETDTRLYHVWKLESTNWDILPDKSSATLIVTLSCDRCHKSFDITFVSERISIDATCEKAQEIMFVVDAKNFEQIYRAAITSQLNDIELNVNDQFIILPRQETVIQGEPALGHDFSGECKSLGANMHIIKCTRCETYSQKYEHDFIVTWNWGDYNNGNPSLSAILKCEDCHHIIEKSGIIPVKDLEHSFESSCTKEGAVEFDASFEFNGKTYTSDPQHYYLEKLGHKYFVIAVHWAKDISRIEEDTTVDVECRDCKVKLTNASVVLKASGNTYSLEVKNGNELLSFAEGVEMNHIYEIADNNTTTVIAIGAGVAGGILLVVGAVVIAVVITKKKRKKFEKN